MLDVALAKASRRIADARRLLRAAAPVVATPDGRWALISVSVTAAATAAVTWLALAASPPNSAETYEPQRIEAALPYDLLARLSGAANLPGVAPERSGAYRTAGILRSGPGSGPLSSATRNISAPNSALDAALAAEQAEPDGSLLQTRRLTIEDGGTIMGMLQEAGVSVSDAIAVVDAMKELYSPRSIRSGQIFEASFGLPADIGMGVPEGLAPALDSPPSQPRLVSLKFAPSVEREIVVRLSGPGSYTAEDVTKELMPRYQHAGAMIDSSLYLAAMQSGIPANIVVEMIHMYSYDVDFQRDVHPGDSFRVFFTDYYTEDGELARSGDILSASMTLGGVTKTLYRFESEEEGVEYFDSTGRSAKSLLMKTPVDGARISSTFGRRNHPILGYTRMHQGVDFAVPTGTPVMAAGNGTVTFAGRNGGYGNFLVIDHANGYQTAYAHLSRFGGGIRRGARVRQGQIIAYSGSTGLATGPHLHYEIRVDRKQVNPLTVKVASGRQLEGAELARFEAERSRIETLVASLPVKTRIADASGLRTSSEQ